jgi:hypothetical protein
MVLALTSLILRATGEWEPMALFILCVTTSPTALILGCWNTNRLTDSVAMDNLELSKGMEQPRTSTCSKNQNSFQLFFSTSELLPFHCSYSWTSGKKAALLALMIFHGGKTKSDQRKSNLLALTGS